MALPVLRVWIRMASWLMPARERSEWHANWVTRAEDWRLLADRGEPVGGPGPLFRRSVEEAFAARFGPARFRHFERSPVAVPIGAAAALLLIAVLSHGFAVTRAVVAVARDMRLHPIVPGYDVRGDRIFLYLAPTVLAWAVGLGLFAAGCHWLRERGWRYWSFLAFKAAAALVLVTLVWVEIGTELRAPLHREGWRIIAGFAMTFAFLVGMGRAMLWTVADQRRRCPMCLRQLVAPVPVGSWASLFEPPATELLCENGHGAAAVCDTETNGRDRWTRLDESWRTLFH